jgi:hypothetical protein
MIQLSKDLILKAEKYLGNLKRPSPAPETLWIAFLNGNVWSWARTREELNLRNISEQDPRIKITQFVEVGR